MRIESVRLTTAIQNLRFRRGTISKLQSPPWAVWVGVSVAAIYLTLLPFIERTWRATGDEPHYLLAAHSLVTDLDFDLTNNYDQLDYLAFYFSKDIDRQIRTDRAGRQILNHHLGYPLLIAPAYALAGRFGVLTLQALLGGLLAAVTYKLAFWVSRDETASLLATLAVALSPPLFTYPYLVYPELIGALLTTSILYYGLAQDRPTPGSAILVFLSLATLPWLNRRYVPLAVLLALFIVWAWRKRESSGNCSLVRRPLARQFSSRAATSLRSIPLLGLIATACSIALLLWFNSQLGDPLRADIVAPADATIIWNRLGRGIGWLVDQQRGLFIFGPIYILALWGLPPLFQNGLKRRNRNGFVIGPLIISLGVTALAGGYWVPWELGPRFLVVALPALAPLLALAWQSYHRQVTWAALAIFLFALSLSNNRVIIQNPELPYKSSLASFYGEKLHLPLTGLLPDLAGYANISAMEADSDASQVILENGEAAWFAGAGRSLNVVRSRPLRELPAGHYRLTWPVRLDPNLPPQTEVARISVKHLGGGQVFNRIVTAAELPGEGSFGTVKYTFVNPNGDRWRTPMVFYARSTGQSNVWAKDVALTPDPFYAWFLPYFYLTLLVGAALLARFRSRRSGHRPASPKTALPSALPGTLKGGMLVILPLAALGNLVFQINQTGQTYDANGLYHFVGRSIADPMANDGQAWLVDPSIDPPQKAIYGPFDIYNRGRYRVTFRMKLPQAVPAGREIARLQVNATANLDELATRSIRPGHFSQPDLYHDFVVTIDNPRRQALSFEVHYLGIAALAIDQVTITEIAE